MKVVIVEDEQLAADAIAAIVKRLRPQTEILSKLGSVEEAVQWFTLHQAPDLIFCDIHLSDGNSFEIFRQIAVSCPVIFTTAYNQYAIDAFKVNSVDYLLKPIKTEDVALALKKYENQHHSLPLDINNLHQLLQSKQLQQQIKSRFLVKQGQGIKAISLEEVAYFWAEEGVVFLVTKQGKRHIINYTLDQLEEQLDSAIFFRANRQLMVHIDAVQEVRPYFKGRLSLLLLPATEKDIIISSSKASDFKEWLDM
ncbi:LytR/AlgR family response regulator transcription factor [Pontibacter cellulosilyticus]|uniref:Response regulator transcription factor n=1 Tax=Pontibacter cellulosilyticus TaxID=1720253 RepID=A0A923N7B5_9BACT|nr:LytTR family DNA-binding domain-containing protein [Pontibacter cellulosilyticus]MBC5992222.1 response regulator transcription factor [Pontibacter cellulosilyticus]